MKKLLRLLSILSFSTIITNNIVACAEPSKGQKTNLNTITELTGLNLKAKLTEQYQALTTKIIYNSDQFKKKRPAIGFVGFSIKYYRSEAETDNENIFERNQEIGNFWIIIKVPSCEPNWTGKTPRLKLMLNP